jgi:hypothetical protein
MLTSELKWIIFHKRGTDDHYKDKHNVVNHDDSFVSSFLKIIDVLGAKTVERILTTIIPEAAIAVC